MATSNTALPDFDASWDYDKPEASEQQFRELLPTAEHSGDRSYHIQLLTQIARAQALQRRFSEAHTTLDAAQALLTDDLVRAKVRYLLERGRVFNSSKNVVEARGFFADAWNLALACREDFYAIDAAHMLGISAATEQQLAWNLRALELAEQTSDDRAQKWLASLYNNIGWTHHDRGQYQQALDYFQKALKCREERRQDREIRIARWCIARCLRSLGRLEESLGIQRQLLAEVDQLGETDGYVHAELGECLLALGRDPEAKRHFALAYAALSQDPWLADNEPARLQRLAELGHAV
jgi:tetratricopeptide (TPR) repeat protein